MQKLAVVTGTSRGVGRALAAELAGRGWRVQGLARGAGPEDLGERYEHARLDLGDTAATSAWFEGAFLERWDLAAFERVALVNNAGVLAPMALQAGLDAEALDRAFRVNAAAPIWLAGFLLERVRSGTLIVANLSSGAATKAYPGWTAYCATKAALRMAGEVLAAEEELRPTPGRCVAVISYAPHVVATAMQEEIRATDLDDFPLRARFEELHEGGALVAPEDPARHLASLLDAEDPAPYTETRYQP